MYTNIDLYIVSNLEKKHKIIQNKDPSFKIYEQKSPIFRDIFENHPTSSIQSTSPKSPPSQPLPSSTPGLSPCFGGLATDNCWQLFFAVHPKKVICLLRIIFLLRSYDFFACLNSCLHMDANDMCLRFSESAFFTWCISGVSTLNLLGII